jgi:hypothetical protein
MLAAAMLASYLLTLVFDPLRDYFALDLPDATGARWQIAATILIGGAAIVAVGIVTRRMETRRT